MELIQCPECGEYYSPSYRRCPFCEEIDNPRKLRYDTKNGRHVSEKKKTHSGRGALIAILILALGLLTWYEFGDEILGRPDITEEPPVEQPVQEPTQQPAQEPDNAEQGEAPVIEEPTPAAVDVSNAKLSTEDFTAKVGESVQLSVSGVVGEAAVSWSSDNSAVAAVSDSGLVKCVSGGTANITAVVGDKTLSCIARVSGASESTPTNQSVDVSKASLNYEDFTAKVGESVQLKVTGTSASVTWSIADSKIATISASGMVKGIAAGMTKAYAKVGDKTLSCIVRIK